MGTPDLLKRVGFGGASIGNLYAAVSDEDAHSTLDAAWASGLRSFDTAPFYGFGLSEQRLGAFLAGKPRDEYRISTKVGRVLVPTRAADASLRRHDFVGGLPFDPVFDFSAAGIRRSLEASLERLGLQYVDMAFIHDPDNDLEQAMHKSWDMLQRLRDEGLVRTIGAGMNACAPLARIVQACKPDVVMIAGRYTLLDQSAANELLPLCKRNGVRVIAAGVFNSGILARPTPPNNAAFFYKQADSKTLARARSIAAKCNAYGVPLPAVAIAFTIRHPAISSIVLGMGSPSEVHQNMAYAHTPIPDALWSALIAEGVGHP